MKVNKLFEMSQTFEGCLNILIDCVQLQFTYVGKQSVQMSQTVGVRVNILIGFILM